MGLPGDLTTCAITGTYLDSAGFPQQGRITFTPSAVLADATGGVVIPMVTRAYPISAQGTFTTEPLVATNASTISPQGWTYTVQLSIGPLPPQTWSILLPASGTPADISGITPVVPQPPVYSPGSGGGTVATGGTGLTALTPYAPLTGGTASTGPVQQATGQFATPWGVLMSQGNAALPVWGPPTLPDGTGGLWELAVDATGAFYTQPVLQDEAYGVITDEAGSALV